MMEERHYAFFQNRDCEYFPCHDTNHPEDTENGINDCSGCLFPHRKENYDRVTARFMEIVKKMQESE